MSQSDSGAKYKAPEDGPIFPYEKLHYDAADKAKIEAMPEIEREELLAQRSEQLERHEQDLQLRRIVAARAREEAKAVAKKRKASAADLEDGQRKSSRQRTKLGGGRAGEASTAIEAYKKQRAEKSQRDAQRRLDPSAKRARTPDDEYSDADGEAESDNDFDYRRSKRRSPSPAKDEPLAELNDIQHIKVGRENFAEVCYYPGFEQAITDCYARVCLGHGRNPGILEYRLCKIKGFTTGRPYAMKGRNGLMLPVEKYIIAQHGKAEKAWSFLECSMGRFTEDEWRRYRITLANEDMKLPTRSLCNAKIGQINDLLNHRFTEAEISEKMKKQRDLEDKIKRKAERDEINEKLGAAKRAQDWDLVDELQDKLDAVVDMKLAQGTTLRQQKVSYVSKEAEKIAELNRRNQRANEENIRKAELAEMRSRRSKKHLAPGVDDLFEGGGGSDISRMGTPVNGRGTPQPGLTPRAGTPNPFPRAGTPGLLHPAAATGGAKSATPAGTPRAHTPVPVILSKANGKRGPLGGIIKSATDEELMAAAAMDLGIELDI